LSQEQQLVVEYVLQGKNIFFTGCAGTGKSTVLRTIIGMLPRFSTYVTASTGIAAVNIGGITLHSWAGIGKGEGSAPDLAKYLCILYYSTYSISHILDGHHRTWWERCKVLIIDEISMIDAELFEKLDFIGRVIRRTNKPFGGIQLVVSGDFFQLPPVTNSLEDKPREFCFKSPKWTECIDITVELTKVFWLTRKLIVIGISSI
jgi:ATP-dependent DNA helicase PIF1